MYDLNKLIEFAVREEVNARKMYTDLAFRVIDRGAQAMLREMADMEAGHEKALAGSRAVKKNKILGDKTPDLMIAEYTVAKPLSEQSGVQDVILFAIQAEAKAHKMYSDLAALAGDLAVKAVFLGMAAEELKHKKGLEQAYDENIFREN
jgi:rubrerythrin